MKDYSAFLKQNSLLYPIAVVLLFVAVYFLLPFRLVAVVSGSMEPTIPTGSLCIVNIRVPYEEIREGDVIVYLRKSDGLRIIHRVIAVTDEGLVTKGDHNQIADGLSTTAENFYGKSLLHIPGLGKIAMKAKTPAGLAIIGAALVAVLIWTAAGERKSAAKQKEQQEEQ